MNQRVIIIHGSYGSPEANWFPWLAAALEKSGVQTATPRFPTPENQSLESWLAVFEAACGALRPSDILVGHSIGAALVLRLIERSAQPIKAALLVAGWSGPLGLAQFDSINSSFFEKPLDWTAIRGKCPAYIQFHGDDDPYVPLDLGRELAQRLGSQLTIVEKGKHLNREAGYDRFIPLLTEIEKMILDSSSSADEPHAAGQYSTEAIAVLSRAKIHFEEQTFRAEKFSAEEVAEKLSIPLIQVYKTLVARTAEGEVVMAVVPGDRELDLKKLAAALKTGGAALVRMSEIQPLTGYLKGGCSPIGTSKQYPVIIDSHACGLEWISVSAGERGRQLFVNAEDLLTVIPGKFADIAAG